MTYDIDDENLTTANETGQVTWARRRSDAELRAFIQRRLGSIPAQVELD